MNARKCAARQKQAKGKENLQAHQREKNRSNAVPGEPPDREGKQDGDNWLIAVKNGERGAAVNGQNRKRGAEKTIPEQWARLGQRRAFGQGGEDQHQTERAWE